MDIRKVKKLIDLMTGTDVSEIEIKEGEESVRICRPTESNSAPIVTHQHQPQHASSEIPETSTLAGDVVTAPMVGTCYLAPSPGKPNFVEVGQQVKSGDTLCLIEAMKMFNEIEAEHSGVITAILAETGHPVEFGQPLFTIE